MQKRMISHIVRTANQRDIQYHISLSAIKSGKKRGKDEGGGEKKREGKKRGENKYDYGIMCDGIFLPN